MTRNVLITGANKGIGKATVAAVLEAHPDTHVLLGSRSKERGEAARKALLEDHPEWAERVEVVSIDVASDDSVHAAAQRCSDRNTTLYGIVNNAGIGLGSTAMRTVLEVNTYGPRRVVQAFLPLLDPENGRIVNVSSASGPMFLAACSDAVQQKLTSPEVRWDEIKAVMDACLEIEAGDGDFASQGFGEGSSYGLSKACLNAYTLALARRHPELTINACTPGFIETDLTRPYAEQQGVEPAQLGMKSPSEGTRAAMHLLFGDVGGSGWYFGSDAVRSPLDRYRSPGDPPYTGD